MASLVYSQPTITHNGNAPQIGDVFYFSNSEEILDPGPSGANQSWDYSVMNVISTGQAAIMNPNNTPFASDFPECNQVFHYDGTSTYIYYELTQGMINHYGDAFDEDPPMIIYFSDPDKEIEFPFSFNDSFTDDYFSSYVYEGMTTHRRCTSTVTADAWGSVTTPHNTYDNVLRIKTFKTTTDSVWFEGIYVYATTTTLSHYAWHTASSHTPVMVIGIIESDLGTSYANHYTTSSQQIISPPAGISQLQVSPNPATNNVQISFSVDNQKPVSISVIDLTGKEMLRTEYLTCNFGEQQTTIQVDKLEAGLYFLMLSNNGNKLSKKIMIW